MNENNFLNIYGMKTIFLPTMKKDIHRHLLVLYHALEQSFLEQNKPHTIEWVEDIIHYSRYWFCTEVERTSCLLHQACHRDTSFSSMKPHLAAIQAAIREINIPTSLDL